MEWIKVDPNNLPENGQEVLCYGNGRYFNAVFAGNDFLREFIEYSGVCTLSQHASHWMPLPEPPK